MIRTTLAALGWIGLAALFVACAPVAYPIKPIAPTPTTRAARTRPPTETAGAVAQIIPPTKPNAEPTGAPISSANSTTRSEGIVRSSTPR